MTPYFDEDGITIYNADCRDIIPELIGIDGVITDPPYGILANEMTLGTGEKKFERSGNWDRERVDILSWMSIGKFHAFWGGNYYTDVLPPTNKWLIWHKLNDGLSFSECEMAWTDFSSNVRHISHHWGSEKKQHPTQKPLAVMLWCLAKLPENCMSVCDPFMGSGTTLRAAKDSGIKAVGIDIEEKYCEIAAKRLAQKCLF